MTFFLLMFNLQKPKSALLIATRQHDLAYKLSKHHIECKHIYLDRDVDYTFE